MKYDAFISFSFKDQAEAEGIVNILSNTYGIRCWICTRDIQGGNYYKRDIVKAIRESRAFVFIQSRSSVESDQVPNEVSIALNSKKTVIPFMIEESQLDEDLEYDLARVHRIDATIPTLENRIAELARAIQSIVERTRELTEGASAALDDNKPAIQSSKIDAQEGFIGREREINELHDMMKRSGKAYLQGLGGIGKSEIAKQFVVRFHSEYDTVLWGTFDSSIREMLVNDTDIVIANFGKADGESKDEYYQRKLGKLKELSDNRTLIIVDNFDTDFDPDLKEFAAGGYSIIFTTRNDHADSKIPTIMIDEMRAEDQYLLFQQNYQRSVSEQDRPVVDELLRCVKGHTLTIELIAKMMKKKILSPRKMLANLQNTGLSGSLSGNVTLNDCLDTAYGFIRHLFNISSLDEAERQILMNLSLLPTDGIEVEMFIDLIGLEDGEIISSLIGKSWVIFEEETDKIRLHPLIKEVVRVEMSITAKDCDGMCRRLAKAVANDRYSFMSAEERLVYRESIKSIFEGLSNLEGFDFSLAFPMFQYLLKFSEIAWVGECAQRCISFLPEDDVCTRASFLFYVGDARLNKEDAAYAVDILEHSVSLYEKSGREDFNYAFLLKYLFIVKSKYQTNVTPTELLSILKKSERIFSNCDETESALNNGGREGFEGSLLYSYAMYEFNYGDLDLALRYAERSIKVFHSSKNKECNFWSVSPMMVIAYINLKRNNGNEAIQIARQVVDMSIAYFSDGHYVTWERYGYLTKIYDKLNRYQEELDTLTHMRTILEQKNEQGTVRYQKLVGEITQVEEKLNAN